jgi:hypothetical protein
VKMPADRRAKCKTVYKFCSDHRFGLSHCDLVSRVRVPAEAELRLALNQGIPDRQATEHPHLEY